MALAACMRVHAAMLVMALVHVQLASGSSTGSTVSEDPPLPTTPSFACSSVATVPGYTCTDHWVETDDGYYLRMQLVSSPAVVGAQCLQGNDGHPPPNAVLWHGLISSSADWIANNRANESLAYKLSDQGWCVWLANSRGRQPLLHKSLKPDQKEFWAWSWDEMAKFDVPAVVEEVLSLTNASSVSYVGHSQGTAIGFTGFLNATVAAKIDFMVAMGPVGLLQHSVFNVGKALADVFDLLCGVNSHWPVTPKRTALCQQGVFTAAQALLPTICKPHALPGWDVCMDALCLAAGCNSHNAYNSSTFPDFVLGHSYFAGTSAQNEAHFAQMLNESNDQVRMFDYGSARENEAHYGSGSPPVYDLGKFHTKAVFFTGTDDKMADPTDANNTLALLNASGTVLDQVHVPKYGHGDFLWSMDAADVVYNQAIVLLQQHRRAPASP